MALQTTVLPTHVFTPWLRKATETFILYVIDQDAWEQALQAFFVALDRGLAWEDVEPVRQQVLQWVQQGTPFWRYERPLAVLTLVTRLLRLLQDQLQQEPAEWNQEHQARWWTFALEAVTVTAEVELSQRLHQLEHHQERLERLERLKSSFIIIVGHELRTPLTVADGYLQMLYQIAERQEAVPSQELRRVLSGVEKGLQRLRELVEAVLDLAYVESGRVAQALQPVWLHRVLEDVVQDFLPKARDRKQELFLEPQPLPRVVILGDPEYLAKALGHLVDNAIKFTPNGGRITVRLRVLPEQREAEIQVADTGIGIPPEAQQDIFDRFVRLGEPNQYSSTRTQFKGGGTGLGLAIVKGVVEAHGGRIWVESPGYDEVRLPGTTFYLRFPLPDEATLARITANASEERTP